MAEVAAWLARRAAARGLEVDRAVVEGAALLHDIDKLLPATDPSARLPHGDAGAAWLARQGWPELASAVAGHPVTVLADPVRGERLLGDASLETRLVAYADKRAGQRRESMDARFASWARRYPVGWTRETARDARARADRLEADVCKRLAIAPADVRRTRWTDRWFATSA